MALETLILQTEANWKPSIKLASDCCSFRA